MESILRWVLAVLIVAVVHLFLRDVELSLGWSFLIGTLAIGLVVAFVIPPIRRR